MIGRLDFDECGNPEPNRGWVENSNTLLEMPASSSFWMRRQQGVCDKWMRREISDIGRDAFSWRSVSIFIRPWNSPERPHQVSDETVRWLFLLGMMTGARLEELCQLTTKDIEFSDGLWRIAITDCDDEVPTEQKNLKSESSRRMVPIHRRLLDVGLVRLVRQRSEVEELRLFPELRRNAFDRLGGDASRRCNRVIDRVSRDRRLCFHSFRHFFKTHCRSARLQDSTNDQLTGHAPPTIGRRYGEGIELPVLAEELGKLDFEFVDWEPILRAVRVEEYSARRRELGRAAPSNIVACTNGFLAVDGAAADERSAESTFLALLD